MSVKIVIGKQEQKLLEIDIYYGSKGFYMKNNPTKPSKERVIEINSNDLKRSDAGMIDDLLKPYKCHGGTNYFLFPEHLLEIMVWADKYEFIYLKIYKKPDEAFHNKTKEVLEMDKIGEVRHFTDYNNNAGKALLTLLKKNL